MGETIKAVIRLKKKYEEYWRDKPESYWFAKLIQECGELGSSLVGDHGDTPDHELEQIAAICLNWLEMREPQEESKMGKVTPKTRLLRG